jgi:hypothetical protein
VSAALVKAGYRAGHVANTAALTANQVLYGPGSSASASRIAAMFGVTAAASSAVPAGHVQVMLGAGATMPAVPATPAAPSSAVPVPAAGAQGGAVHARNGIPCVD